MPVLSAADVVQAKTGQQLAATTAVVALDDPTQEANTVTLEIHGLGITLSDPQLCSVPAGWSLDANPLDPNGLHLLYMFRKQVTGGEQSWNFGFIATATWVWRVTEWDTGFEPVSPLEAVTAAAATGTGVTALSTGTTHTTSRAGLACLAWHHWQRPTNTAQSMTFSGHTGGFVIRDELRNTSGNIDYADCWSWAFSEDAGSFETTATVNLAAQAANDIYMAQMVVYAATTYA